MIASTPLQRDSPSPSLVVVEVVVGGGAAAGGCIVILFCQVDVLALDV